MVVVQPGGILVMMQPKHKSGSCDSRRSCSRVKFPTPGSCSHRVQIWRRRQWQPRRRRRVAALHGVALVGPRLDGVLYTPESSWFHTTHTFYQSYPNWLFYLKDNERYDNDAGVQVLRIGTTPAGTFARPRLISIECRHTLLNSWSRGFLRPPLGGPPLLQRPTPASRRSCNLIHQLAPTAGNSLRQWEFSKPRWDTPHKLASAALFPGDGRDRPGVAGEIILARSRDERLNLL